MKRFFRNDGGIFENRPLARKVAWVVVIALCGVVLFELRWAYFVTRKEYLLRQIVHSQEVGNWEDELWQTERLASEFPSPETNTMLAMTLSTEAHLLYDADSTSDAFVALDRAVALAGMDHPNIFVSYCLLLTKEENPEAAEFMLNRAAYWQEQEKEPGTRWPKTNGLVYRCDGFPYFEKVNADGLSKLIQEMELLDSNGSGKSQSTQQ